MMEVIRIVLDRNEAWKNATLETMLSQSPNVIQE